MGRLKIVTSAVLLIGTVLTGRLLAPGWSDAIVAAGITVGALAIGGGVFRTVKKGSSAHNPFDAALGRRPQGSQRPSDLVALERLFGFRRYEPDEFEARLKPVLARIQRHLAIERYGVVPEDDPERFFAGELRMLDPAHRCEGYVDTERLERLVDAIEAV